jgi:predicted MPP superfamily phosphohydrolase
MNKIYDVTVGIEAESRKEAEQKLLQIQQLAVSHSKRSDGKQQVATYETELSPVKAAMGILAIIGLRWVSDKLNPNKKPDESTDPLFDMKMRKNKWQRERRKRKQEEERANVFAFLDNTTHP